jgi:hypothetical protein
MANITTDFLAFPASAIRVIGLPPAPYTPAIRTDILSSLTGRFTVSADTASVIEDLRPLPRRLAA